MGSCPVVCYDVVKEPLVDPPRLDTQADAIIAGCGSEVCDGAYSVLVMKNEYAVPRGR